jgi:hypothetical protein
MICHHENAYPEATQIRWASRSEALQALAELTPCDDHCCGVHDVYWSEGGKIRGLSFGKIPVSLIHRHQLNGRGRDRPA